ncbi:MAG: cation:proton antiporter [Erysipelotrichaceae bacterium]|nr:cation:proton antiporter [Erysipelotrichaceae bacterium]
MLFSLALIFLIGLGLGKLFERIRLPKLIGMILTGMILGPHALNLLDEKILIISSDLRQLALVIILIRAGLNLDLKDLKQVGRPALLLSFVPALFEIIGYIILGPMLLGLSTLDSALLGSVIAAVSPAVIVPKMLKLKEKGWGTKQLIPQLIMAGASMDDVFVIVLFTSLLSLSLTGSVTTSTWIQLPSSIMMGIFGGLMTGKALSWWFTRFHIRDSGKVMIIVSVAFILIALEQIELSLIAFFRFNRHHDVRSINSSS